MLAHFKLKSDRDASRVTSSSSSTTTTIEADLHLQPRQGHQWQDRRTDRLGRQLHSTWEEWRKKERYREKNPSARALTAHQGGKITHYSNLCSSGHGAGERRNERLSKERERAAYVRFFFSSVFLFSSLKTDVGRNEIRKARLRKGNHFSPGIYIYSYRYTGLELCVRAYFHPYLCLQTHVQGVSRRARPAVSQFCSLIIRRSSNFCSSETACS